MSSMRSGILILLLTLLVASPVFAQEFRSRGSWRSWGEFSDWEYRTMRSTFNSATRQAIEALGAAVVQNLPIPVVGVQLAQLTKNFGDPRGDGTRTHEGLDIMAPQGTPILSPTDAVVTRVGDGSSSGLYVRTANPGDESFVYMHLSKVADGIAEGAVLKRGDVIGYVGNTGNASGGAPHLHFEIRKDGAQDPYPRLTTTFTIDEQSRGVATAQAEGVSIAPSVAAVGVRLRLGDSGAEVTRLQQFLIARRTGGAAVSLAGAGATGYFGSLTEAALREYQASASLAVTGTVDTATYALVFTSPTEGVADDAMASDAPVAPTASAPLPKYAFTRDLERGAEGEDVRALQQFLNSRGFLVAASGAGSPGNESTYFGPATEAALARFQAALGVTPAAGYFGPKTRALIALL